jgi:hypothetical protein
MSGESDKISSADLKAICDVCNYAALDPDLPAGNPKGKDAANKNAIACSKIAPNIEGASELCKCWLEAQPQWNNYAQKQNIYSSCISASAKSGKCIPGPKTVRDYLSTDPNATKTVYQYCYAYDADCSKGGDDGNTPVNEKYCPNTSPWNSWTKTASSYSGQFCSQPLCGCNNETGTGCTDLWSTTDSSGNVLNYGIGGPFSNYTANGKIPTASVTSTSYLPFCACGGGTLCNKSEDSHGGANIVGNGTGPAGCYLAGGANCAGYSAGNFPCSQYCQCVDGTQDKPCGDGTDSTACIGNAWNQGIVGNGSWCKNTTVGWNNVGAAGCGSGLGYTYVQKNKDGVLKNDARIVTYTNNDGDGPDSGPHQISDSSYPPPPGSYWQWDQPSAGADTPAPGLPGGYQCSGITSENPVTYRCTQTATSTPLKQQGTFHEWSEGPSGSPAKGRTADAVCSILKPTLPSIPCCMNTVNVGKGVEDIDITVKQSCDPKKCDPNIPGSCDRPVPGEHGGGQCDSSKECDNKGVCQKSNDQSGVCICGPDRAGSNCEKCNTSYFKCNVIPGAVLNEKTCKCECGPGYWGIGDELCFKSDTPWYNKIRDWFILLWKNIDKETKRNKILLLVGVGLLIISLILLSIMIPGMILV